MEDQPVAAMEHEAQFRLTDLLVLPLEVYLRPSQLAMLVQIIIIDDLVMTFLPLLRYITLSLQKHRSKIWIAFIKEKNQENEKNPTECDDEF